MRSFRPTWWSLRLLLRSGWGHLGLNGQHRTAQVQLFPHGPWTASALCRRGPPYKELAGGPLHCWQCPQETRSLFHAHAHTDTYAQTERDPDAALHPGEHPRPPHPTGAGTQPCPHHINPRWHLQAAVEVERLEVPRGRACTCGGRERAATTTGGTPAGTGWPRPRLRAGAVALPERPMHIDHQWPMRVETTRIGVAFTHDVVSTKSRVDSATLTTLRPHWGPARLKLAVVCSDHPLIHIAANPRVARRLHLTRTCCSDSMWAALVAGARGAPACGGRTLREVHAALPIAAGRRGGLGVARDLCGRADGPPPTWVCGSPPRRCRRSCGMGAGLVARRAPCGPMEWDTHAPKCGRRLRA